MQEPKKKRVYTPEQKARIHERYIRDREQRLAQSKARYQAKREEILAKDKEYREKNRDERNRKQRERYRANVDVRRAQNRAIWASLTPEQKKEKRAKQREWENRNRERMRERSRAWRAANAEKARKSIRDHYKRNPHKQRERHLKTYDPAKHRERYARDPQFKMMRLLRSRLKACVKAHKAKKTASTMKLAGCDLPFLIAHLEKQFLPGMTWENHGFGPGKWNVDHIRPCASFDLTDPEQQRECFSYKNLQPLWHEDNAAKGAKVAA